MICKFTDGKNFVEIPTETILVQIIDQIKNNPDLSAEKKEQGIKSAESIIRSFQAPKIITGYGGVKK